MVLFPMSCVLRDFPPLNITIPFASLKSLISNKRFIHSPAEKKGQNSAVKLWPYQLIRLWYFGAGLLIKR